MNEITPDHIKLLVEAITNKSIADYIPIFLSSAAPLVAVGMSYFYFRKQHIQSARGRVIEREIDRLFEAADHFFEYSDAIGLYLGMLAIKADYLSNDKDVPPNVQKRTLEATENVFPLINSAFKSEFFLRSLGANEIAVKVDCYRERSIHYRQQFLALAKSNSENDHPSVNSDTVTSIESKRDEFINERNAILLQIAAFKDRLIRDNA